MRNKTVYELYRFKKDLNTGEVENLYSYKLSGFRIKAPNEVITKSEIKGRVLFKILALGKVWLWYVTDEERNIIHKSICVSKCLRFPFMKKGDFEIGPCLTVPEMRGRGIYPRVLSSIVKSYRSQNDADFYMLVAPDNRASIKGIEKAGFVRVGTAKKHLGAYKACFDKEIN